MQTVYAQVVTETKCFTALIFSIEIINCHGTFLFFTPKLRPQYRSQQLRLGHAQRSAVLTEGILQLELPNPAPAEQSKLEGHHKPS